MICVRCFESLLMHFVGHSHWPHFSREFNRCCVRKMGMHFHTHQVLVVIIHNQIQTGLQHNMTAVSLPLESQKTEGFFFSCLTSQQFGLTVDKLWFSQRAVALASVMKYLDKGALFSCWTSNPLVKSIIEHQVKLWTVLGDNNNDRDMADVSVLPQVSNTQVNPKVLKAFIN